jgi:hypothetical protein
MMQLQAPDAGPRLARIVDKSPIGKWLGPVGESFGWIAEALPLVGPPLLVGVMAARPEAAAALEPFLRQTLTAMAIDLQKQQKEAAAATERVAEVDAEIQQNVDDMLATVGFVFTAAEDESAERQ